MDLDTFERWMDERQGYDVKTILAYLRTIKQFIKWVEEEREIDFTGPETITAGLIRDYRTYLAIISKKNLPR